MKFPIANYLTVARIVMIPLVVILFYAPYPWSNPAAAVVFIAAALTDSLDGYLARKLGQTSALGAFLDPVADKLMVAVALVLLVSQPPPEMRWPKFDPHVLITLTAEVIVVDASGLNAIVLYLLGLCHGLGRSPILIARDPQLLPFNLPALRCVSYDMSKQGLQVLRIELARRIRVFLASANSDDL